MICTFRFHLVLSFDLYSSVFHTICTDSDTDGETVPLLQVGKVKVQLYIIFLSC